MTNTTTKITAPHILVGAGELARHQLRRLPAVAAGLRGELAALPTTVARLQAELPARVTRLGADLPGRMARSRTRAAASWPG